METSHLKHKWGGRVTAIHSVGHTMDGDAAIWFYIGDIEWKDGGTSRASEIPPWALCFDQDNQEAHKEYGAASDKLNTYLKEKGRWHKIKFLKDGRAVSWTPKHKKGSVPL